MQQAASKQTDIAFPAVHALDVLLVVAGSVGSLLLAGWLVRDFAATLGLVLGMLLLQAAVLLGAVHLVVVRRRGIGWRKIGLRPASRGWYIGALVIGLTAVPTIALVNLLVQWLVGAPFRNPQLEHLAPAGFSWRALAGMLVAAAIVAPVAEEVVFRGLLYSWLRRYLGAAASIALNAIIFAFAHGIVVLVPALLVNGAILAFMYERSRSLWPSIIAHGMFNAMMVAALYGALATGVMSR